MTADGWPHSESDAHRSEHAGPAKRSGLRASGKSGEKAFVAKRKLLVAITELWLHPSAFGKLTVCKAGAERPSVPVTAGSLMCIITIMNWKTV